MTNSAKEENEFHLEEKMLYSAMTNMNGLDDALDTYRQPTTQRFKTTDIIYKNIIMSGAPARWIDLIESIIDKIFKKLWFVDYTNFESSPLIAVAKLESSTTTIGEKLESSPLIAVAKLESSTTTIGKKYESPPVIVVAKLANLGITACASLTKLITSPQNISINLTHPPEIIDTNLFDIAVDPQSINNTLASQIIHPIVNPQDVAPQLESLQKIADVQFSPELDIVARQTTNATGCVVMGGTVICKLYNNNTFGIEE